jgi:UDP-N-acetylmuramyl pentapeptide phosphotransferase/UDP-N-acetylglucosamine-1-phosphate transferase
MSGLGVAMTVAVGALASSSTLALAWLVHTRVRGVFPDDQPHASGRKAHGRPIAMAGLLPAILAAAACVWSGAILLAVAVLTAAAIGFCDDLGKARPTDPDDPPRDLVPWWGKGLVLLACAALVPFATFAGTMGTEGPPSLRFAAALVVFAFVVVNAINFLDNMDGVATAVGCATLCFAALHAPGWPAVVDASIAPSDAPPTSAHHPLPSALLLGIWLGFLPFNWPSPRMFLGDAGAYALGLACAAAAVTTATTATAGPSSTLFLAGLATLVPLVDFTQVVVCRLVIGVAPWIGDRRHLSHLLHLHLGVPRRWVAPLLAGTALLPLVAFA